MKRFFLAVVLCAVLLAPFVAFAQARDPGCKTDVTKTGEPVICLAVPFGSVVKVSGISQYIQQFYQFFIGAVLSLAVFMIVIGGVQWVFALGNSGKISAAKKTITNAFLGVLLAFISVGMLRIVNPDLITLKLPEIRSVEQNQFFGVTDCWQLPPGTVVNNEGVEYVVAGDPLIDKPNFKCGDPYHILGNIAGTIKECKGTMCLDAGGNEGLCMPNGGCLFGSYIYGTINWVGGYYVEDHMRLVAICENSSGQLTTDQTQSFNRDVGSQKRFYAFSIDKTEMIKALINPVFGQCFNKTLKGYLLGVQINDASEPLLPTIDDDVLLSKECNKFVVDGNDPAKLVNFTKDGSLIPPGTPVWTAAELLSKPIECNIEINGASANYSGSQVVTGPPASKGDMRFQPGIDNQWNLNHQTQSLQDFLNMIVPKQSIVVKSISDNNIISGACEPWKPKHNPSSGLVFNPATEEMFSNTNQCNHMKGSAHYGGGVLQGSQITSGINSGKPGNGVEDATQVANGYFACGSDIGPVDNDTYAQLYNTISEIDKLSHPGITYYYFCENTSGSPVTCPNFKDGEDKSPARVDHIHLSAHGPNDSCYMNFAGALSK